MSCLQNVNIIYTEGTGHVVERQRFYHYRDPEHNRWMPIRYPQDHIIVCFMREIDALRSNFLAS